MPSVMKAVNLIKRYDTGESQVNALDGVSFDIQKGEFVSITGPSGSGKTTLLHVASCLLRPSEGEVYIDSIPISSLDDNELAQIRGKKIGFVFQTFNLIPRLSAWENVALPLWFQGVPTEERKQRAIKVLEEVGLSHRVNHKATELSGGQKQRVAIARALVGEPEVIVADEPTGNLDSASGKQVLELIQDLNKKGKTIVMVTHEPKIAELADRTFHIVDGKIDEEIIRKKN